MTTTKEFEQNKRFLELSLDDNNLHGAQVNAYQGDSKISFDQFDIAGVGHIYEEVEAYKAYNLSIDCVGVSKSFKEIVMHLIVSFYKQSFGALLYAYNATTESNKMSHKTKFLEFCLKAEGVKEKIEIVNDSNFMGMRISGVGSIRFAMRAYVVMDKNGSRIVDVNDFFMAVKELMINHKYNSFKFDL